MILTYVFIILNDITSLMSQTRQCPDCECRARRSDGELICIECGLIIDDQRLDRSPSIDDNGDIDGIGSPVVDSLHDRGLTTKIGSENRDEQGKIISGRRRVRIDRLRMRQRRKLTKDWSERCLLQGFSEIRRMVSALGLPERIQEISCQIFRRVQDEGMMMGRSIEAISSAAIYIGSRFHKISRTFDEIERVSRVERLEIERSVRYLSKNLELPIPPADPREFIDRIISQIDVDDHTRQQCYEFLDQLDGEMSGCSPQGIAASIVYLTGKLNGQPITQSDIGEIVDVSNVTIRKQYQKISEIVSL